VGLDDRIRQMESNRHSRFRNARETHRQSLEYPLIPYALELADKAAAACSVEASYPFFDRRLVEFCLALPADQKLRAGWRRSILRRAMQGILPPEIQWRESKANLSPNFYRNLLILGKGSLDKILTEDLDAVGDYINKAALSEVYSRYIEHPSNSDAMTLFLALTFAAWVRQSSITL
jgi:asparagine synthase (glutamine-hydrolysing)